MKTRDLQSIAHLAVAAAGRREEFYAMALPLLKEAFGGRPPSLLLYHPERRTFFRRIYADGSGGCSVRAISLSLEEFPRAFADQFAGGSEFSGQGPYPFDLPEFSGTFLCHPIPFGETIIGLLVTGEQVQKGETIAPFVVPLVEAITIAEWHREIRSMAPQAAEKVENDQLAAIQEKYRAVYKQLETATGRLDSLVVERDALARQVQKATSELQSIASELSLLRLDLIESGGVRNVMELLEGELLDGLPGLAEGHFRETLLRSDIEGALLLEIRGTDPQLIFQMGDWSAPDSVERCLRIIRPLVPLLSSRGQEVGVVTHGGRAEVASREASPDLLLIPLVDSASRLSGIVALLGANLPWPPPHKGADDMKERMAEVFSLREAEKRSPEGGRALKAGVVRGIIGPLAGPRRGLAVTLRGALLVEIDCTVADNPDRPPDRIAGAIDHIVRGTGLVPIHPLFGRFLAFHPAMPPPVEKVIAAMAEIRILLGAQKPRFLIGYFPVTVLRGAGSEAVSWIHSPFLSWTQAILPALPEGGIALSPNLARGAGLNIKLEERDGFFLAP
jgi:hypothetical protein